MTASMNEYHVWHVAFAELVVLWYELMALDGIAVF